MNPGRLPGGGTLAGEGCSRQEEPVCQGLVLGVFVQQGRDLPSGWSRWSEHSLGIQPAGLHLEEVLELSPEWGWGDRLAVLAETSAAASAHIPEAGVPGGGARCGESEGEKVSVEALGTERPPPGSPLTTSPALIFPPRSCGPSTWSVP